MNRILEALKRAPWIRGSKSPPGLLEAAEASERRKNPRWALDVAVYVYGHEPGGEPLHEEAHTLNVCANGALLLLSIPVQTGQTLLLTNELTGEEQHCRVVFLGAQHSRTVEAGVAFAGDYPEFWQVHGPRDGQPAG